MDILMYGVKMTEGKGPLVWLQDLICPVPEPCTRCKNQDQLTYQIASLKSENKQLKTKLESVNKVCLDLEAELDEVSFALKRMKREMPKPDDVEGWRKYFKASTVKYSAPTRKHVCEYFKHGEAHPKAIITAGKIMSDNSLTGDTDEIVLAVLKWIDANVESQVYKSSGSKKPLVYLKESKEVWQTAYHTWDRGGGDCDDIMIVAHELIVLISEQLGVWDQMWYRLWGVAGNVNRTGSMPFNAGSHAYLLYASNKGILCPVETTYYADRSVREFNKKDWRDNTRYGEIIFMFTTKDSYAHADIELSRINYE